MNETPLTGKVVELELGNTAMLRNPATLTNGERRPLVVISRGQTLDPLLAREIQHAVALKDDKRRDELLLAVQIGIDEDQALRVGDVAITVLVESWTLDLPLPIDEPKYAEDGATLIGSHVLDRLGARDYDRLQWATGELMPDLRWHGGPPAKAGPTKRSAPAKRSRSSKRR